MSAVLFKPAKWWSLLKLNSRRTFSTRACDRKSHGARWQIRQSVVPPRPSLVGILSAFPTSITTLPTASYSTISSEMVLDLDPTTQSNYDQIASEHVDLDWTLDFEKSIISGSITHTLAVRKDAVAAVVFDTIALSIDEVLVADKQVDFLLGEKHPVMGSALTIPLPSGLKTGNKVKCTISYRTSQKSMSLQWLAKEQTRGKLFPFLFSQCQPIYARSLAPLQDTPSVKITYNAKVTSKLPVLLSAIRVSPPSDGPAHGGKKIGTDAVTYTYKQPFPIPTYLVAIAAGNLAYHPCPPVSGKSWKTGVWAEPETLKAAYDEFGDAINEYVEKAEEVLPPYQFGVYDVLVLPPSFPYGGMENACLSFLTPTLLVGDHSLVDVVIHELSHSWFGNGVTQAHSTHFWLNEGWTTYMERLILGRLHGAGVHGLNYIIGAKAMFDDLERYKDTPKYQRLVIEFDKGEDPDDAYSKIPYEKGANLILHLERTIGGLDIFLPYVRDYVSTFMGKSITTTQWKDHLYAYYKVHGGEEKVKALDSIDWDAWFYGEGTKLPVDMQYDTTLAEAAYALAKKWSDSRNTADVSHLFKPSDLENFDSNQKAVFLERLHSYPPLPSTHVKKLGAIYGLAHTPNAELRFRYYAIAFADPTTDAAKELAPAAANWVVGKDSSGVLKGRMKFCRPVFREVNRVNHKLAVDTFVPSKDAFHPIARRMIEKDLGLA
ncbi:metalloprotease [Laetiporus sulphureus 93-53]|uniref:Metalloprotease n=1 Tax=Laetiporus sulphureus 93-53 TaxID=1314785 RepID=A0A165FIK0_9APHY|nr:metalloprotease [Laetiporus sulphureus 93-53]KZT09024.1 metalloprotease [Laetiporus sulphureus 93-53]